MIDSSMIKGIIVPVVTPMHDDGSINTEELKRQTDRLIQAGVHGVFAFGTNGEGYILSSEEKRIALKAVIEAAGGRVPVYAGTGCISTKETVEQSLMAEEMGADVLSIITPSFAAASQNELIAHYRKVASAVHLPIVLYNIPARTGNKLTPDTVAHLAEEENIVGAKDSSGDFANILSYISASHRVNPDFRILSGNDRLIIWTLIAGGCGGIAGCANVYPKTIASIYSLFLEGRIDEAIAANESIGSFRECFRYGNPNTIVKKAVELLGYGVGPCRAPFNGLSDEAVEAIRKVLEENRRKGME